jgi:transposase
MDACLYASDLRDEEWTLLKPLLHRTHPAGRRQTYPLRRIVDAIFYLLHWGSMADAAVRISTPVRRLLSLCPVA